LGGSDNLTGPYTNISSLNSSFTTGSTGSPGAAQSKTNVTVTLSSPWTNGSILSLRWDDPNNPNTDDAIALDNLSVSFTGANQAPTFSPPFSTTINEGQSGTFQVTPSGPPSSITYAPPNAPAWVHINSSTGLVSFDATGTNGRSAISSATQYTFDVTASNGVGTAPTQTFTVTDLPALISYGTAGSTY